MNKYEKWYVSIVENASTKEGYTECHHIVPKSIGGTDDPSNLVNLTAREHFICHWLLTKIHKNGEEHWKMLNALRMMRAESDNQQRYTTLITGRVYEKLKVEHAALQSERIKGDNNVMKKAENKEKVRQMKLGKKRAPFSDSWLVSLSKNHKSKQPNFVGTISEDTKRKISNSMTGRTQSEETKKKKADAIRGSKREKKHCQHCCQMVAVNGYARWHGDNCKHK